MSDIIRLLRKRQPQENQKQRKQLTISKIFFIIANKINNLTKERKMPEQISMITKEDDEKKQYRWRN